MAAVLQGLQPQLAMAVGVLLAGTPAGSEAASTSLLKQPVRATHCEVARRRLHRSHTPSHCSWPGGHSGQGVQKV